MKKTYIYILAVIASVLTAASCTRVSVDEEQVGYLYVSLDRDASEDVVFKAAAGSEPVFSLNIYDEESHLVKTIEDHTALASTPLRLNVGSYTVVATSAANAADAAFDAPFYKGEKKFEVLPEQVSNVDITCTLANVKVTADFSENVKANFPTYKLLVSNGKGELVFSSEDGTADKEGFFSVTGTLTWTLMLENTDGAKYNELTDTYTDVKAKQHYNMAFDLETKPELGAGGFRITVDNSMVDKDYDVSLDFGDETIPQITANFEYDEVHPLEINAGDNTSKIFSVNTADGLKNLLLSYPGENAPLQINLVGADPKAISDLQAIGIRTAAVTEGAFSASVDITSFVEAQPIGSCSFALLASDIYGAFDDTKLDIVLRSPVETEAVSADPWATFVTLKGKWYADEKPAGITFQYKKTADPEWIELSEAVIVPDLSTRTYTAEVRGLQPATEYQFKAVSTKDKETKVITFSTETAETLHNMNFDNWYQSGDYWMPNLSPEFRVWDTANPGSGKFGIFPTTPETSDLAVKGEGKKAARLESKKAAIVLAAGNVYTGNFGAVSGMGASLDWGVPFQSRPLALKGFYKYNPAKIDMAKDPYKGMKGQMDLCQIMIFLTDWDKPFTVNTNTGTFVDLENDPHIIAIGRMEDNTSSASYKEFTIELDYRDKTRTPKYIVIAASASKYGDYFTGGVGSTLLIDEFEFVYNPDQLSK